MKEVVRIFILAQALWRRKANLLLETNLLALLRA